MAARCYEDFADEVVVVEDWPDDFSFSYMGEVFQEGLDNHGDWVIHMDIDNFLHENSVYIKRSFV